MDHLYNGVDDASEVFGLSTRAGLPSRLMKTSVCRLLKKTQRRGARKIDERRRTWAVRWSETIERNEAYEFFSEAC